MTKEIHDALDLAMEALEGMDILFSPLSRDCTQHNAVDRARKAITAIKQARSAPVQEPVVGMLEPIGILMKLEGDKHMKLYAMDEQLEQQPVATEEEWDGVLHKGIIHSEKLITPPAAQRQWTGLTDEEVMQTMSGDWTSQFYFARAIEAKLKERNV